MGSRARRLALLALTVPSCYRHTFSAGKSLTVMFVRGTGLTVELLVVSTPQYVI